MFNVKILAVKDTGPGEKFIRSTRQKADIWIKQLSHFIVSKSEFVCVNLFLNCYQSEPRFFYKVSFFIIENINRIYRKNKCCTFLKTIR